MIIKTQLTLPSLTAYMTGELDHHSAAAARQTLDDCLKDVRITHLVLELSGVTFMDSSGLGVILGRYRTIAARGGELTVSGANKHVDRILKMSGVYALCGKKENKGGVSR